MVKILTKNCLVCAKLFEKPYTTSLRIWTTRSKYCSVACKDGAPRSADTRLKQRLAKVGKPSWNKGLQHTEKHKMNLRKKKPMSEAGKQSHRDSYRNGNRRPWNKVGDGVTPIHERIRKSLEYKQWRQKVFERDNFTCKGCGTRGGNIHADHIKPFALYPDLRFILSNGRTLCIPCHRKTETYGKSRAKLI